MDQSTATQTLDFLTSSVLGAAAGLEEFAFAVVTIFTTIKVIHGYTKQAAAGDPLSLSFFGEAFIGWGVTIVVVGMFFQFSFLLMEKFREFGMFLSGSTLQTVDIGELFRQREIVSERIYTTIDSFKNLGWIDRISSIPTEATLRTLGGGVFILYMAIALIAIWVYSKFLLGFLVGGVFIGGLAWGAMYEYGKRAISYTLISTMPLFLLAFMQGLSARLLDQSPVLTGDVPMTIAEAGNLLGMLALVSLISLVAASVPREWLSSLASTAGAPSATKTAGMVGGAGAAGMSAFKSVSSSMSKMISSGGGGTMPPPSGGSNGAGTGVPRLNFRN